jgi:hypothetical protein
VVEPSYSSASCSACSDLAVALRGKPHRLAQGAGRWRVLYRGDFPAWALPILAGYVLLFPILFAALNGLAWKRWRAGKWAIWFATLSLITALVHLAGYAVP